MGNGINFDGNYDVAIIGAGASGLAAALTLKKINPELSTAIFEKKEKAARKLAASGNGRCNLSNAACAEKETVFSFFEDVGIMLRQDEDGRIYPYSEDAGELAELLTRECIALGTDILLNHDVKKLEADSESGFLLFVEEKVENTKRIAADSKGKSKKSADKASKQEEKIISKVLRAKQVLIATGGKSYPIMGTTGDGYIMARKLGHTVIPTAPALTAVQVESPMCSADGDSELKKLKGVRVKGTVRLLLDGNEILKESGEIQFRDDSVSGICIMNLSGHIKPKIESGKLPSFEGYKLQIDLADAFDLKAIERQMKKLSLKRGFSCGDILKTLVKGKLAASVLERSGLSADMPASEITDEQIAAIAAGIKCFTLNVVGLAGWKEAQVTCGGVDYSEVDENTMQSKLVPRLYFSGEVLEYAGPCGGFNLHHAWLSGIRAGKAMAAAEAAETETTEAKLKAAEFKKNKRKEE